jgi:DNA-binding beta-propeller fold protein YncE
MGTHAYTDFCSFCPSLTKIDIFMVNLYDPKSGNIDKSDYIALLILSGNAIKGKIVLNYHIPYWAVLILLLVSITLVFSSLLYLLPLAYSQKFYPISSWVEFGIKQTSLSSPSGIAVDPSSGNVYVADTANSRIQVFSNDGTYISNWGKYDEVSRNGTLKFPQRIALDEQGNVYVADTANNRIQVFSNDGTYISNWGKYGRGNGSLNSPQDIALDEQGNVYVADTANSRIQVFSNDGTYISNWGRYGTGNGSFNQPSGIAVDQEGNVYVVDTANSRIQVFSNDGTYISNWGKYGHSEVGMRFPTDIVIDPSSNNMLVTDTGNSRILVFHSHSPISDEAFPSEEEEISGNDAGDQTPFSGFP